MNAPRRPPRRQVDGVLLLDKPLGMSSNAALQIVRRLFNAAKGGHTGTLDPLATGLLPLCFGEATKFSSELLNADKTYCATVRLGITTDTADAEGIALSQHEVKVTEAELRTALECFVGTIEQTPPMHSALKRDGRPLYEYARQGIEVERAPRQVTISRIALQAFDGRDALIEVDCSKGTYIRTLAEDIGHMLGCGAHLLALRRTRIGKLRLDNALAMETIEQMPASERDELLASVDSLLADLPQASLDTADALRMRRGQAIPWSGTPGERLRLFSAEFGFMGVGVVTEASTLQASRLVAEASPSPP